jgi:hypothetical protein
MELPDIQQEIEKIRAKGPRMRAEERQYCEKSNRHRIHAI